MANKQALRELQTRLAERMQAARTQPRGQSWLAVECRGHGLLLPLEQAGEIFALAPLLAVPHTQPWFAGVANLRGGLHGVVDLARFLGLHELAADAGRSRQAGVSRHERARQTFGERDVGGVVGSHVRAEFVGPDHQRACREADDRERDKVDDGRSEPSSGEVTSAPASPKDGDSFHVDEIRRRPLRGGGDSIACRAPGWPVIADDVGQY